jgi:integrase
MPTELPEFFKQLAADTSQDFRHFVLLSLLTGARRNNVLAMRWQDIDLATSTWRIPNTKNDEPHVVALVPEAVEILKARKPRSSDYVISAASKAGYMTPPKKRWASLLKRAGIQGLRIHDLRRSLGSWKTITGSSLAIIGKSLGHKSADATMIYARLAQHPSTATRLLAYSEGGGTVTI